MIVVSYSWLLHFSEDLLTHIAASLPAGRPARMGIHQLVHNCRSDWILVTGLKAISELATCIHIFSCDIVNRVIPTYGFFVIYAKYSPDTRSQLVITNYCFFPDLFHFVLLLYISSRMQAAAVGMQSVGKGVALRQYRKSMLSMSMRKNCKQQRVGRSLWRRHLVGLRKPS